MRILNTLEFSRKNGFINLKWVLMHFDSSRLIYEWVSSATSKKNAGIMIKRKPEQHEPCMTFIEMYGFKAYINSIFY